MAILLPRFPPRMPPPPPPPPPPEVPTPTADDIEQQLQQQTRLKGIGRVLRKLGLMRLEDTEDVGLSNLKVKMGQAPQIILNGLRQLGRNPDSETFLKSLKPDIDDGGLNTIFGTPPSVSAVSAKVTAPRPFPGIKPLMPPEPPVELPPSQPPIGFPPIEPPQLPPEDGESRELWDKIGGFLSGNIEKPFQFGVRRAFEGTRDFFLRTVPNLIFPEEPVTTEEERNQAKVEWDKNVASGMSKQDASIIFNKKVRGATKPAAMAERINEQNRVSRDKFRQTYIQAQEQDEVFWKKHPDLLKSEYEDGKTHFDDPGWYIYTISKYAPMTIAALTAAVGTTVGTRNPVAGMAAAAAVFTPISIQDVADDLIAAGVPEQQAALVATPVGLLISGLESVGEIPILKATSPVLMAVLKREITREVGKLTMRQFVKKGITTFTQVEIAETATEVLQQAIQNATVRVFDQTRSITEGLGQTAAQTGVATLPFAGFGGGASIISPSEARSIAQELSNKARVSLQAGKGLAREALAGEAGFVGKPATAKTYEEFLTKYVEGKTPDDFVIFEELEDVGPAKWRILDGHTGADLGGASTEAMATSQLKKYFDDLTKVFPEGKTVEMAPSTSVQTGLPGMGVESAQGKMFEEFGTAPGTGGAKPGLVDVEALKRAQSAKPVRGQRVLKGEAEAEIEGLQESIAGSKLQQLYPMWQRMQRRKDANPAVTIKEYREFTGRSHPAKTSLTPDGKHIYWRDALDSVVSEYGYEDTEQLMEALNKYGATKAKIKELQAKPAPAGKGVSQVYRTEKELSGLSDAELAKEIKSRRLSHSSMKSGGAGQQEFEGTYISTEASNRYAGEGGTLQDASVRIKNPKIFRSQMEYEDYRGKFLPEGVTLGNATDAQLKEAVQKATNHLKKSGFDSVYLPESDVNEGILVVFNKANVTLSNPRKVTYALHSQETQKLQAAMKDARSNLGEAAAWKLSPEKAKADKLRAMANALRNSDDEGIKQRVKTLNNEAQAIEDAYLSKVLPPEVLKDYPDLAAKAKPAVEGVTPEVTKLTTDELQNITDIIDHNVFKDNVAQSIQKDGQKLLDAIRNGDTNTLDSLMRKYQEEATRGISGGGGPKPSKPGRVGSSDIWNAANKALGKMRAKFEVAIPKAEAVKPIEPLPKAEIPVEKPFGGLKTSIDPVKNTITADFEARPGVHVQLRTRRRSGKEDIPEFRPDEFDINKEAQLAKETIDEVDSALETPNMRRAIKQAFDVEWTTGRPTGKAYVGIILTDEAKDVGMGSAGPGSAKVFWSPYSNRELYAKGKGQYSELGVDPVATLAHEYHHALGGHGELDIFSAAIGARIHLRHNLELIDPKNITEWIYRQISSINHAPKSKLGLQAREALGFAAEGNPNLFWKLFNESAFGEKQLDRVRNQIAVTTRKWIKISPVEPISAPVSPEIPVKAIEPSVEAPRPIKAVSEVAPPKAEVPVKPAGEIIEVSGKRFIIRQEPEPLLKSGKKFVAYNEDGTPRYLANETKQELVERLRQAEIRPLPAGEVPPVVPPEIPAAVAAALEPKPTPIQNVRTFYKAKIEDMKAATVDKVESLKDWQKYTVAEKQRIMDDIIAANKGASEDKIASLRDWQNYTVEEQSRIVSDFYKAKIADLKGVNADKIASLKDWAKYTIEEQARVKAILTDYIQEKLPLRERGKLLDAVKNIKNQEQLDETIARVDRMAEQSSRRILRAGIIKELKRARPKRVEGIVKGRFGGDIQAELDAMIRNLKMTRDDALARITDNQQAYENGKMTYEDMVSDNSRLSFMGIEGMTAAELQETLDYIKSLKEVGRAIRTQELEKWKEGIDAAKSDIVQVITGGKEVEPGVVKEFTGLKALAKRVEGGQVALTDFLDILSGTDKTSKPYSSALNLFVDDRVLKSYNAEQDGLVETGDTIITNFKRIFNVEKDREANDILRRMGKEKVTLGTFKNTDGKDVTLTMTKGQMIDAYNLMQAEENLPTFTEGNKWTQEMMNAVTGKLTLQERVWAAWQREFLADYWTSINEVYEPLYGVKLGRHVNYWPRKRDVERSDIPEHILVQEDYAHFASVTNKSLKARTENKIPFKFLDANTKLISHITQMEHFKAWAFTIRDLRSVFMSKDIKNAIRQFYGQDIGGKIDDFISVMARGGIEKAKRNHLLDTIRGNMAVATLGLKPGIAIKQPLALLGYATEMPYKDFVTGLADFMKNPVKNYQTLREKSSSLRARYRAGQYERDIKVGVQGGAPKSISGKGSWKETVLTLIQIGDRFGTVPGMWAKYQSGLKAGLSDGQAILEAEKLTNRTQNTSQLFTLTTIQHGGSWARLLTMFQDQPNKYFRLLNSNFRNMINGRQGKAKSISNIVLLWVVMPMLFQWMSDAFKFKPERQARAFILGPVNYLLIFGQMAQSVVGWITGEKFPYQPSPVLDIAEEIQIGIGKIKKLLRDGKDPTKDVTIDDIVEMAERFVKVGGMLTGVPTPYLVQVEKAFRGEVNKKGERVIDLRELIFSRWALEEDADAFGEAKKGIPKAIANLGKEDVVGRDDALIEAQRRGFSQAKITEIENKDWNYDTHSLHRDIQALTEKVSESDRAKLDPIVSEYWQFKGKKDDFSLLSDKEQEQYVKDNPGYITDRLFWGELTTIPGLKTAEALAAKAEKHGIKLDMIPAFQLTDKGKERIPSKRDLWKPYFEYNDLPGTSYLNFTKKQVDAGELPEKYRKDWEQFQKFTNDRAKTAFKKARNKKGGAAYGGWRDDFRRENLDFDKWAIELSNMGQSGEGLKPLTKAGTRATANIRAQTARPLFGGFRPVSGRRRPAKPAFTFPKARMAVGAGVGAPRAPSAPRV